MNECKHYENSRNKPICSLSGNVKLVYTLQFATQMLPETNSISGIPYGSCNM